MGLLAGSGGRQERAQAERVAQAIGPAVGRVGGAEAAAAQGYTTAVQAQRAAEATGVPKLSERAQAALTAVSGAKDEAARIGAWKALRGDKVLAGEVDGFMRAVEGRFGAEGVRAFARSGSFEAAKITPGERAALGVVGRSVQAMRIGQHAVAAQTEKLAAVQRLSLGARLKP